MKILKRIGSRVDVIGKVIYLRGLYNRRNSLHYLIPPILLGAFVTLFTDLEQAISQ